MSTGRFLDRLSDTDRTLLESKARVRTYRRGAVVFLDGDRGGEVLFLRRGQIKITVAAQDGREVLIEVRGEGEVIGEMALIDDSPRSASAFALTSPTEVLAVSLKDFRALVDHEPTFTRALLDEMVQRVRDSTFHQLELSLDDVAGRVARRLVDLADRFGKPRTVGVEVRSPLTQQELADWSGVSRQAVVKELSRLRELGWIETKGRTIVVRNVAGIEERAAELSGLA